jgi:hypothetical protein
MKKTMTKAMTQHIIRMLITSLAQAIIRLKVKFGKAVFKCLNAKRYMHLVKIEKD